MDKAHWMVSGVGRSGTTMTYGILFAALKEHDPETLGRYEPFLWGRPVWDKLPENFDRATLHNDSVNAPGVRTHLEAPLFLDTAHPVMDSFVDDILPADRPVVTKVIRGAGRLSAFLKRDPELRIIHLIRNPLDVVNSGLIHFSFFGDEFHPSDEVRFNEEAAARFGDLYRPTLEMTEAGRSFEWWKLMNEAAFESAEEFPDRLKIIAYENLIADPARVMAGIVEFLGGDSDSIDVSRLAKKIGPVSGQLALRAVDRDALLPQLDAYFDDKRLFSRGQGLADVAKERARLQEKYAACVGGRAFTRPVDPGLAPNRIRSIAIVAQEEARKAYTDAEERGALVLAEVNEAFASAEARIKGKIDAIADLLRSQLEDRKNEIADLKQELERRNERVGVLEADLANSLASSKAELAKAKAGFEEARKEAQRDVQASQQLSARLRDRVAALKDEQMQQGRAFDRLKAEKGETADKLRKTENRLREVAGEREQYRQQLAELVSVLAPRFRTVATLRPLRYVLRQRQRVKSGQVQLDEQGIPQIKKS